MKKINIGLIGVGGYAANHLGLIKQFSRKGLCDLKAVVIREPGNLKYAEIENELHSEDITIYRTYQDLYEKEKGKIDLIIIPCSIDRHAELSISALQENYHVFCEKPACGTIEQALNMKKAKDNSDKMLTIGYQHIFSNSIQNIKQIRLKKGLGELIKIKTMAAWPRSSAYYNRNSWAGRMEFNGRNIFDSPAQNALAHYLNNMLYISGDSEHESAYPETINGENYKVKDIESADTQYLHIKTLNNIEIFFMVTHACLETINPVTEFLFEKGKIIWYAVPNGKTLIYKKHAGKFKLGKEQDNGRIDLGTNMYNNVFQSINNNSRPLSSIHNALQHTICINKSFESSEGIHEISDKFIHKEKAEQELYDPGLDVSDAYNIIIKDIEDTMEKMYKEECSFSELNCAFAVKSKTISSPPRGGKGLR